MPNSFSKEERVMFDELLAGFQDALTISRNVATHNTDQTMMERTGDIIWRPQPYILPSYDGLDQSANFNDKTQLSVPATIGFKKSVPFQLTATEARDMLQSGRMRDAAQQRLSSDINVAVTNVACLQGTLVVKRTGAIQGFDDVAACEAIMREQGVSTLDASIGIHVREYNSMASNLANRAQVSGKVQTAYDQALIGRIAAFEAFKLDYTYRLTAAGGTTVTVNGANQRYVPKATSTASGTGETSNVDNRYQNLAVTVSSGTIKVGDSFTIAGVNAVHQITKQDTGQLKTFRVTAIVSGGGGSGVIQISPAIVAADSSPTQAETQYKNVTATPANGAAITWLNTTSANVHPFWTRDSIEILPGRYSIDDAGISVMRGTTDQGFELVFTKQTGIDGLKTKFRVDTMFGVANLNPEMNGVMLLGQA